MIFGHVALRVRTTRLNTTAWIIPPLPPPTLPIFAPHIPTLPSLRARANPILFFTAATVFPFDGLSYPRA